MNKLNNFLSKHYLLFQDSLCEQEYLDYTANRINSSLELLLQLTAWAMITFSLFLRQFYLLIPAFAFFIIRFLNKRAKVVSKCFHVIISCVGLFPIILEYKSLDSANF